MTILRRTSYIVYVIALLWFTYVVVTAARNSAQPEPRNTIVARLLPQTCAPFYNDGTDRWIDCMGVGYVSD